MMKTSYSELFFVRLRNGKKNVKRVHARGSFGLGTFKNLKIYTIFLLFCHFVNSINDVFKLVNFEVSIIWREAPETVVKWNKKKQMTALYRAMWLLWKEISNNLLLVLGEIFKHHHSAFTNVMKKQQTHINDRWFIFSFLLLAISLIIESFLFCVCI